jgi:hypothetical protein
MKSKTNTRYYELGEYLDIDKCNKKTIVVLSCTKKKERKEQAKAIEMYRPGISFQKGLQYYQNNYKNTPLYILSSNYGFLHPNTIINHYDCYIGHFNKMEKKTWAEYVTRQINNLFLQVKSMHLFCSSPYTNVLCPVLDQLNINYWLPLNKKRPGEIIQWYNIDLMLRGIKKQVVPLKKKEVFCRVLDTKKNYGCIAEVLEKDDKIRLIKIPETYHLSKYFSGSHLSGIQRYCYYKCVIADGFVEYNDFGVPLTNVRQLNDIIPCNKQELKLMMLSEGWSRTQIDRYTKTITTHYKKKEYKKLL